VTLLRRVRPLGRIALLLVGLLWTGVASHAEPAPAKAMPEQSEVYAAEWLIRQSSDQYTLQLLTVSSARAIDEAAKAMFSETNQVQGQLATFRYQRGDTLLYVLTFGIFESAEEAASAQNRLRLTNMDPAQAWIRPLGDIKQSIRTTLQN